MSEAENVDAGVKGVYEVYRVRSGAPYSGWYLVVTASRLPDARILAEALFLPLDIGGPFLRFPARYEGLSVRFALDHHRETALTTLRQHQDRGDEDRPLQAELIPNDALRQLWFMTLPMPDHDQFRQLYRSGLIQLSRQSESRALLADLQDWMVGYEAQVNRMPW